MNEKRNKLNLGLNLKHSVETKMDLKFFSILKTDENELFELIRRLEKDELYRKLSGMGGFPKIIRLERKTGSGFAWTYNLGNENFANSLDSFSGGGEILKEREKIIKVIRRIGAENFEKYFLSEKYHSKSLILKECGIKAEEYEEIFNFVAVFTNAYENIPAADLPVDYFNTVASIIKEKSSFRVEYLSAHYAKGIYSVDKEKLDWALRKNLLTENEISKLKAMLKLIETVNWRKKCVHKIIEGLVKSQMLFFGGGKILPMSQRSFAKDIGISNSSVSRITAFKSIIVPWGEEIALRSLFVSRKSYIIDIIRDILEISGAAAFTDDRIKRILTDKHGFGISRRSVNLYRKEIEKNGRN